VFRGVLHAARRRARDAADAFTPRPGSGFLERVLNTFEIEPTAPQRGSVIWLHGLGASNHDFDPVIPELAAPYLRFVFPAAPLRAVTINQGVRMPAWYDILSFADPPLR
jgi:phospholipase/carboxylesterase